MAIRDKFTSNIGYYPGTDTLVNDWGITDRERLVEVEKELVAYRIVELNDSLKEPHKNLIPGSFDLNHLQAINRYLFQDLYSWWAGEVRNYDMAKEGIVFCYAVNIEAQAKECFGQLRKECYYATDNYDKTIAKLVDLFCTINLLHPFREGNGRTQRFFIEWLAKVAGVDLELTGVKSQERK